MDKQIVTVTAMTKFKGEVEGMSYDNTTLYIDTRMDDRKGTRRGRATMDYKYGLSNNYDSWVDVALPCQFEVEFDTVTTGKVVSQIIEFCKPIAPKSISKPADKPVI